MQYDYSMLGARIYQASMEAGERWMLNEVAGKPLYAWDSRGNQFRTSYDPLRRPIGSFLRQGAVPEQLIGRAVYGESNPNPELKIDWESPSALRSGRSRHQRGVRLQGKPSSKPVPVGK